MNNSDMATHIVDSCGRSSMHVNDVVDVYRLTRREMMAMHMMAAQISAVSSWEAAETLTDAMDERGIDRGYPEKLLAINAVNYADALLAELERTK